MKILEITWEHGNDFCADMVCEHCGHIGKLTSGYRDGYYFAHVIPAMRCEGCGKNRAGELEYTDLTTPPCAL